MEITCGAIYIMFSSGVVVGVLRCGGMMMRIMAQLMMVRLLGLRG